MIGDAVQYVTQISFRIKIVEFGRTNQSVDHRGAFAAGIRGCKQIVLRTQGHAAQSPLGGPSQKRVKAAQRDVSEMAMLRQLFWPKAVSINRLASYSQPLILLCTQQRVVTVLREAGRVPNDKLGIASPLRLNFPWIAVGGKNSFRVKLPTGADFDRRVKAVHCTEIQFGNLRHVLAIRRIAWNRPVFVSH